MFLTAVFFFILASCSAFSPKQALAANGVHSPIETLTPQLQTVTPPPSSSLSVTQTAAGHITVVTTVPPASNGKPQGTPLAELTPQPGVTHDDFTATPDDRLPPENWMDWPYMPTVSARAIEIYRKGIARGNDPHAFSVVGDCQAIPFVFMGKFDRKEYTLQLSQEYLQETIDYFAGSFNREGMAVRGGFTAASILSPLQADPGYCQPGETPLDCEFRVHNPSIILINLETWADRTSVERYEGYLRQILDKANEHGVLPILATKADAAETGVGKPVINPIIAKLAYEYDLPLWNFFRAAQFLPYHGIDPGREGLHLTQEGLDLKSMMGLQALDLVWRAVRVEPDSPTVTATAQVETPLPTLTEVAATFTVTPTVMPTPVPPSFCISGSKGDCVLFALAVKEDGSSLQSGGVFLLDLATQQMAQIAPDGFDLQDVSPDGQTILINNGSNLYTAHIDGTGCTLITDGFFYYGNQGAYWMKDGKSLVLIANRDGNNVVWSYRLADSSWTALTTDSDSPVYLYPSVSAEKIYWEKGNCSSKDFCTTAGAWVTTLGEGAQKSRALDGVQSPAFSSNGLYMAFMDAGFKSESWNPYNDYMLVETLSKPLVSRRMVTFPTDHGYLVYNRLLSYYWSPDSSEVLALVDSYSDYFEKSLVLRPYLFDLSTGVLQDYDKLTGAYGSLKPQAVWSPDGSRVLLAGANLLNTGQYQFELYLLDFRTRGGKFLDKNASLTGSTYRYVTHIYWVVP